MNRTITGRATSATTKVLVRAPALGATILETTTRVVGRTTIILIQGLISITRIPTVVRPTSIAGATPGVFLRPAIPVRLVGVVGQEAETKN